MLPPEREVFAHHLRHIRRRIVSTKDVILPCLSPDINSNLKGFTTSYDLHYQSFPQQIRQAKVTPISPTRKNRPHPSDACYLNRLDVSNLVCNVKTKTENKQVDMFGAAKENAKMNLITCSKEMYKKPNDGEWKKNTRYSSNKNKKLPATGIIPSVVRMNGKKQLSSEHWLPGTLKLTTDMTVNTPYKYLPRRRRRISLDYSAAGVLEQCGQDDSHRYHFQLKRRGKSPVITISSSV